MNLTLLAGPVLALFAASPSARAPAPPSDRADASQPSLAQALREVDEASLLSAPSPDIERFRLLALACYSAEGRDRRALEAIEATEATKRPGGRAQGLEWAYEELFATTDRLRQTAELLARLTPHEALVRAILTASPAQLDAAAAALSAGEA